MKVIDKINNVQEGPFWSFEYFPPKTEDGVKNLYKRLERMSHLNPLFIDVTWGAGGVTSELTLDISCTAQQKVHLETMMHLTCTNMPVEKLHHALVTAKAAGIQNILALRGDPPHGTTTWEKCDSGFEHAVDLVRYIRREFGDYFGICVAGYPEGHVDCADRDTELVYLKDKVDAGADLVITQLFYDIDLFLDFVKKARALGINCPIIPGIMPIQNYSAFRRMTSFCKTHIPKQIEDHLELIKDDEDQVKAYGVELGIEMCKKILAAGVPGIHFYTLNLESSVKNIMDGLGFLPRSEDETDGHSIKPTGENTSL